jgi:hypothetical protein
MGMAGNPFVQAVHPMLALRPDFRMRFKHGFFVDRKREEEICVQVESRWRHG